MKTIEQFMDIGQVIPEARLYLNQPEISLKEWEGWVNELAGLTVSEALVYLRERLDCWQDRMTEMTEMCLLDLAGKLKQKNILELLQFPGREPVYSVFVILNLIGDVSCGYRPEGREGDLTGIAQHLMALKKGRI